MPGIGAGRIRAVVEALGSASAAFELEDHRLRQIAGIGAGTVRAIRSFDRFEEVTSQLRKAERVGARLVSLTNSSYPKLLREIYDPPAFLWVRGTLAETDRAAIAVVGTRRPTEYGRRAAQYFATELARCGVTIVSGLAHGIDAVAHRAALESRGRTIAVLGSGVDRIYPGSHHRLTKEIIQSGAVISEQAMGAEPDAPNFPRRNRIISGLALGTLVIEAFDTGGALITAHLALEQNREVFAVPHTIENAAGVGVNRLIRDSGAKLVQDVGDILEEVGLSGRDIAERTTAELERLTPAEQQIYNLIGSEPIHVDTLCRRLDMDPSIMLVHLLGLEFKQYVRQLPGKLFVRTMGPARGSGVP